MSAVYLKLQPRNSRFPTTVTNRLTDISYYRVADTDTKRFILFAVIAKEFIALLI